MPIRVLLAHVPQELRATLYQALSAQPDMVLTAVQDYVELLLAAAETHADAIVIGMDEAQSPGILSHLLEEYPDLKIIIINLTDQQVFLYELRPELVPIGEASSLDFPNVIRAVT